MLSVFSYGEVLIDLIPTENGNYYPFVGGAPANVAAATAKLGGNSHFIGGISSDPFGQRIQQQLQDLQITFAPELVTENKTAMVVVSLDNNGERSFQFYREDTADLTVTTDQLSKLTWSNADIFHFCSNTLTEQHAHEVTLFAIHQAKQAGAVISFDVNLRLNLWPDNANTVLLERVFEAMSCCDVVKLSDEELTYLSSSADTTPEDIFLRLFNVNVKTILVTAGGSNIQVITPNCNITVTPPKVDAIDTTAGGDSFIGGFLYQLSCLPKSNLEGALQDPVLLKQMTMFAARCGAYTVSQKGSFDALPTVDDLIKC